MNRWYQLASQPTWWVQHQKQNKWSSIFKKFLPMDWVVYAHICNHTGMSKLSYTCSGTSYLCWWYMWLDSLCRWGPGQPSVWILWRGKSRPRGHWTSRSLLTWTMQSGSRINYSSVSRRVRSATFLWLDTVRALPSSQTHPSPHNSIWDQILGNPCREKSDEV